MVEAPGLGFARFEPVSVKLAQRGAGGAILRHGEVYFSACKFAWLGRSMDETRR